MAKIQVQLLCGCWVRVRVDRVSDVPCALHGGVQAIVARQEEEWTGRCDSCVYTAYHGQSEADANRAASHHEDFHPSHWVHVKYIRTADTARPPAASSLPKDDVGNTLFPF